MSFLIPSPPIMVPPFSEPEVDQFCFPRKPPGLLTTYWKDRKFESEIMALRDALAHIAFRQLPVAKARKLFKGATANLRGRRQLAKAKAEPPPDLYFRFGLDQENDQHEIESKLVGLRDALAQSAYTLLEPEKARELFRGLGATAQLPRRKRRRDAAEMKKILAHHDELKAKNGRLRAKKHSRGKINVPAQMAGQKSGGEAYERKVRRDLKRREENSKSLLEFEKSQQKLLASLRDEFRSSLLSVAPQVPDGREK
jgi:hypothetical protein